MNNIKRLYNLNQDEYLEMAYKQEGFCAICGREAKLCIDHKHSTGRVRSLLCLNCNLLLGHAHESPEVLRRAASYLEHYQEQEEEITLYLEDLGDL